MHKEIQKNNVKVYALSHRGASPSGNVHLLSQRCAIQSELQEKAPQRNLWGFFYFTDVATGITISLY